MRIHTYTYISIYAHTQIKVQTSPNQQKLLNLSTLSEIKRLSTYRVILEKTGSGIIYKYLILIPVLTFTVLKTQLLQTESE